MGIGWNVLNNLWLLMGIGWNLLNNLWLLMGIGWNLLNNLWPLMDICWNLLNNLWLLMVIGWNLPNNLWLLMGIGWNLVNNLWWLMDIGILSGCLLKACLFLLVLKFPWIEVLIIVLFCNSHKFKRPWCVWSKFTQTDSLYVNFCRLWSEEQIIESLLPNQMKVYGQT